jgi:nucleoside 2-deoxyribosyltransferase
MRVFISYSFADHEIMKQMTLALNVRSIDFYTAEHDAQFGKQLSKKIHDAIKKSDVLIAIITKDHPSPSVDQEVGFAINEEIDVIPFVEEGAKVGFMLGPIEQVRFTKNNIQDACDKVARYITKELEFKEDEEYDEEVMEYDGKLADESKVIEGYEFEPYGFDFEVGDKITGKISSNLPVNVYIMDNKNLERFEDEYEFDTELESEQVIRYSLNFLVPKTRTWHIVIENPNSKSVNVDVKLSVNAI